MVKKRRLPDQITEPGTFVGYQVRIARGGVEHSRCFTKREFGTKKKALQAAVEWRDRMLEKLPPPANKRGRYLLVKCRPDPSVARVGVTRYLTADSRRVGSTMYVRYGVCWTDPQGHRRIKNFQAGRADDFDHALDLRAGQTAVAFRDEWEYCIDHGIAFDPGRYRNWRAQRLYPFRPPKE